jgi:ClpA/ClpB-like protein
MPNIKTRTTAVALAVGLSLGGGAYATAASQSSSSAPPGNPNEQALTGDTAEKVNAAALAKLPGATILRVETDEDGVYEAHVRKTDGTEVEIHVDKDFTVTSVDTRPAGGPGGPGGRGHGGPGGGRVDTAALAKSLGVTEDKLQAALDKVRPAKADRDDKRTAWTAAIAKALGQSTADVQAVLDANRPDPPAAGSTPQQRPAKPDDSALAKALAAKFGISQDKAQAALDAARGDKDNRGDELAAALAKELGLDATKVKSALEAQRPARP